MCGIAGFVDYKRRLDESSLDSMAGALLHRGPDAAGKALFRHESYSLGFAHRRLSIIDLSEGANQPFSSECGNFHVIFNGEIYNHAEIRRELEGLGHAFRTRGDTEVLLHSLMQWGSEGVRKCIGMFAFAYFDKPRGEMTLCRDRAGVKPLYYYWKNGLFLFASELKAFHTVEGFDKNLNLGALGAFFRHAYIPAPLTIFENAHKLKPGHVLTLDLEGKRIRDEAYWDIADFYNQPRLEIGDAEALEETERLMSSAFNYRMVSDVPVGVFLSGGYDSSLVAALIQKQSPRPLSTFTIGFDEQGFDEAPAARAIARHLGTNHHEYYCTARDAAEIIPRLPEIYDEPFGDSSEIPSILVARIAGREVKVVLSGEGGDETFCGYGKYLTSERIHATLGRVPAALRPALGRALGGWAGMGLAPARYSPAATRLEKIAEILTRNSPAAALKNSSAYFTRSELSRLLRFRFAEAPSTFQDTAGLGSGVSPLEKMLALDYKTYLADDILTKVDRATMSVSIEGREPFLDHRLTEWAARLPMRFKLRNGETKWICRQILHRHVPRELMERPKMGFGIPIFKWLSGELKESIHHYLDPKTLAAQGIFNPREVETLVADYFDSTGKKTKHRNEKIQRLWLVLMFQMWQERWMGGAHA